MDADGHVHHHDPLPALPRNFRCERGGAGAALHAVLCCMPSPLLLWLSGASSVCKQAPGSARHLPDGPSPSRRRRRRASAACRTCCTTTTSMRMGMRRCWRPLLPAPAPAERGAAARGAPWWCPQLRHCRRKYGFLLPPTAVPFFPPPLTQCPAHKTWFSHCCFWLERDCALPERRASSARERPACTDNACMPPLCNALERLAAGAHTVACELDLHTSQQPGHQRSDLAWVTW